jgi:uncharacterized protein YndB with AHSA1/START domain
VKPQERYWIAMSEPNGFTLRLATTLPALRPRVFELLTSPDEIQQSFGPRGFTLP